MLKSPYSQDSADNPYNVGTPKNSWRSPQIWVQIRSCTTERGNLQTVLRGWKDLVPKPDHSVVFQKGRFLNHIPIRTRKVCRRYKRVEKTINTTHSTTKRRILKRYIFLTRIQKLYIHLSQCKYWKMIFC